LTTTRFPSQQLALFVLLTARHVASQRLDDRLASTTKLAALAQTSAGISERPREGEIYHIAVRVTTCNARAGASLGQSINLCYDQS
jgi:hypothetical protein